MNWKHNEKYMDCVKSKDYISKTDQENRLIITTLGYEKQTIYNYHDFDVFIICVCSTKLDARHRSGRHINRCYRIFLQK